MSSLRKAIHRIFAVQHVLGFALTSLCCEINFHERARLPFPSLLQQSIHPKRHKQTSPVAPTHQQHQVPAIVVFFFFFFCFAYCTDLTLSPTRFRDIMQNYDAMQQARIQRELHHGCAREVEECSMELSDDDFGIEAFCPVPGQFIYFLNLTHSDIRMGT